MEEGRVLVEFLHKTLPFFLLIPGDSFCGPAIERLFLETGPPARKQVISRCTSALSASRRTIAFFDPKS